MFRSKPITSMAGAFDVRGMNVAVTGGNRGIGLGIATAFAQSGCSVAIMCRDIVSGRAAAEELSCGVKCSAFQCDVSDLDSAKRAAEEATAFLGHVDVLVNNAGVSTVTTLLGDGGLSEWHRVIDTNLHGPANAVHAFAPGMRAAGRGGLIVNVSSIGGLSVANGLSHPMPPYFASKAALNQLTRYLALELSDCGIRVNAICPGPTHSDLDKDLPPEAFDQIENSMPMHRFAEPIEIGAMCVYLASPAGCHVDGAVLVHDGGLLCLG